MFPDPAGDLQAIERLIQARRFPDAARAAQAAVQRDAESPHAWFLLGASLQGGGAAGPAANAFRRSAELDARNPRPLARAAAALTQAERLGEAREAADRALALGPGDLQTLDTLGVVYTRTGDYQKALKLFLRAERRGPKDLTLLHNLAWAHQYVGDIAAAQKIFRRILTITPDDVRAWHQLVELSRQTPENNHLAKLQPLFAEVAADPDRALFVGHALGKTYEDLGDYEAALDSLRRGKAAKRQRTAFYADEERAVFTAAADTFRGRADRGPGVASARPIFVVGLPRTGTTLVDRILASHPEVVSAGERKAFPMLVKQMTRTPGPRLFDAEAMIRTRGLDFARLGRAYLDSLRGVAGRESLVIDKLPFNFLMAGLIHRALPDARIVCLRRDPMDSCLSNYRQMFAVDAPLHAYAYDLGWTGEYYVLFDRLVAHWRATLPPDRFMEVRYEDVVSDQETQARRLLDFCGLAWDPAVLEFHRNEAGVATASAAQVRQPVHTGSVGRWRRYGAGLQPLEDTLRAGGVEVA